MKLIVAKWTRKQQRRLDPPRTWGEIKRLLALKGLKDEDRVYSLDLGPFVGDLVLERSPVGVEITDDVRHLME
jgi:hypothetical protein